MKNLYIWDPVVRLVHWLLAAGFAANALFTDPDGTLHQTIGYFIAALLGIRLLWGLIGSRYARFSSFRPDLGAAAGHLADIAAGRRNCHKGHSPLGALMICNLLLTLLGIALTGWLLTVPLLISAGWPEELHEVLVTWAEISVLLHAGAVLFETRRTKVRLARAMITGYKNLPDRSAGT
ncbi:cytochrome b/b6 domain-containing protein [Leisingera sp. MMG026]|uniref:cytochrome b/b6 domain-containing protein n=1 Tax=Leisingera sp. MMG026 TaxID=2909982 RepID=UPI001F01DC0C|nr:cytochrome b/b6 domain-containing protein [Leisingera sp. MMG026]MCF6432827.1 cytochrome b/b6 domain-containing protein [Leisingera sp. MMG026]